MVSVAHVRDIAEQIRGVTYAKGEASTGPRPNYLTLLRAGNITDHGLVFEDLLYVPESRTNGKQRLQVHDVVIAASSGSLDVVGKAAQLTSVFYGTFGAFCKVLRPKAGVDPRYFAHFFQTTSYRRTISGFAAGININNLRSEHLDELRIPLPPIEEQRRIADILDRADALRAKRREALVLLDDLTQSIFLDMFGATEFEQVSAGELMPEMRNGLSPATAGEHPARVLTLTAVTQGTFDPSAVKSRLFTIEPPADKRVSAADFLMCRGNGNKALVGVGVYSTEDRTDLAFPDTVIAGRVDPSRVELPFLNTAWRQPRVRDQIEAAARTTNGTYKVNQQTLSAVTLPLPPLELQHQFAQRVCETARLREWLSRALDETNDLFATLQQRAFRGEL